MKHPSMKWFLEKAQSIIIRNLSKILQKYVWRSSFLVHLHACRLIAGNFTMKWTPSQSFFNSILSPNYAPPCIDLSPSPIKFWRAPPLPPPCSQHLWEILGLCGIHTSISNQTNSKNSVVAKTLRLKIFLYVTYLRQSAKTS